MNTEEKQHSPDLSIGYDYIKWYRELELFTLPEGWGVFNAEGHLEIQYLGNPAEVEPPLDFDEPKFANDDEAIAFVRKLADAGSHLHQCALTVTKNL